MGDANNGRASKGKGVLGGFFKRVAGGKDDVKESTPRTGTSLKDRFSKLKPNAVPTDGGQQRTLDDIHAPDDDVEVKVIHTSAARSARFSDRVGLEIDQGEDTFERTISFEEPDDEYEDTALKGVSDHDRIAVGKYASNRILFEDDAPRAPEKRDDIRSRYISLAHATGGAGNVDDTRVNDDAEITEVRAEEEPVKAERTSLAERLKARQAGIVKAADRGPEITVQDAACGPEITVQDAACGPDITMHPLAEGIADQCSDEAPETSAGTDHHDTQEDHAFSTVIPDVTDAVSAEIEDIDAGIDTGDGKTVDIPEASAEVTDAHEETFAEKVCTECKALPCAETHSLLPAAPVIDEPASCEEPVPAVNEALDEIGSDAPVPDELTPSEQPVTMVNEALDEIRSDAPVPDELTPSEQPVTMVNEALDEIRSDAPSYDDAIDADADDAERGIIKILSGVVIDGTIVPAEDTEYKAGIIRDIFTEDKLDIAESTDDIQEISAELQEEEENRICFSFLSESSERSSAEVRFVWG